MKKKSKHVVIGIANSTGLKARSYKDQTAGADDTLRCLVPISVNLVDDGTCGGVPGSHCLDVRLVCSTTAVRAIMRNLVHKAPQEQHAQSIIACERSEGVSDVSLVGFHILCQWLKKTHVSMRILLRVETVDHSVCETRKQIIGRESSVLSLVPTLKHFADDCATGRIPIAHLLAESCVRGTGQVQIIMSALVHEAFENQHAQIVIPQERAESVRELLLIVLHIAGKGLHQAQEVESVMAVGKPVFNSVREARDHLAFGKNPMHEKAQEADRHC